MNITKKNLGFFLLESLLFQIFFRIIVKQHMTSVNVLIIWMHTGTR